MIVTGIYTSTLLYTAYSTHDSIKSESILGPSTFITRRNSTRIRGKGTNTPTIIENIEKILPCISQTGSTNPAAPARK